MYKKYSKEMKIKASELVVKDGISVKVVAEKFGINQGIVYRWISEYNEYGEEAFIGSGKLRSEDAKIRKLEKELEELRMENEILKKAAAYFAKHPSEE